MYTQYFSLKQEPFSIAPDPRYLYMSERHREALAHLLYGIGSGGGFVLLTGEIGAGKTTVCRCFIEQIPADCRLAYIFNPKLTVAELLQSICDELRIALTPADTVSVKRKVDAINRYLLESHAQGKNNVLIIDEAQNLSAEVLEQLRLLTNLETNERKLLQIILIGQPELRTMLARPELEQLAQRIIARYHLGSLSADETSHYVQHRIAVAGGSAATPFSASVMGLIHRLSKGVPRRINLLCDRALLGAYAENTRNVSAKILKRAATEVFGAADAPQLPPRWPAIAAALLAGAAISAGAAWQLRAPTPAKVVAAAPKAAPVVVPQGAPLVHASEAAALSELAQLWGQALPEGAPCEAALRIDLRCHLSKGALVELRQLDRPAVLSLRDGVLTSYAVVTAMDDKSVTLRRDGKLQTLALGELAQRFDGAFTTYWRVPRAFREQLGGAEKGADVDWLGARLAQINNVAAPAAGAALSDELRELLRAFQARQNLKADGVAGPRTFMRLNQLTGVDEPRLLRK